MKRFFLILFILSVAVASGNSQILQKNMSQKADNGLATKSASKKKGSGVKKSQKRTIDIQTPEVRARMKQNKKETAARERVKKRKNNKSTRKAGKKYK